MSTTNNVDLKNVMTTQTNARSLNPEINFKSANIFQGIQRLDGSNIKNFNFYQSGYGRFFFIGAPMFCQTLIHSKTEAFVNYIARASKSFEGIQDTTLDFGDVEGGIAGNRMQVPTNSKDEFDGFTIKVYEQMGSPVREFMDFWLTGIRDPKSGWGTYHGLIGKIVNGKEIELSIENHVGTGIYISTDPSGRKVEYAAYITNIMPKNVPKNHLNLNHGDHGTVEMDLQFTGHIQDGPCINKIASTFLNQLSVEVCDYYDQEYNIPGRILVVNPKTV